MLGYLLSMRGLALQAGNSFEHFAPFFRNEGFPSFRCVPLCFLCTSEGRKEASPPFESLDGHSRKDGFFLTIDVCMCEERAELRLGWCPSVVFQSQTFQHWRGIIVDTEPRRLRLISKKKTSCLLDRSGPFGR